MCHKDVSNGKCEDHYNINWLEKVENAKNVKKHFISRVSHCQRSRKQSHVHLPILEPYTLNHWILSPETWKTIQTSLSTMSWWRTKSRQQRVWQENDHRGSCVSRQTGILQWKIIWMSSEFQYVDGLFDQGLSRSSTWRASLLLYQTKEWWDLPGFQALEECGKQEERWKHVCHQMTSESFVCDLCKHLPGYSQHSWGEEWFLQEHRNFDGHDHWYVHLAPVEVAATSKDSNYKAIKKNCIQIPRIRIENKD